MGRRGGRGGEGKERPHLRGYPGRRLVVLRVWCGAAWAALLGFFGVV